MTEPNQVFQINRIRDWFKDKWGNADSENVPLLNRERGTMEAPQRSNFRNIVTAAVFILVVVVVGLIIGFSIDGDNQRNGPVYPPFSNHERVIIELPSNQSIKEYLRYYTSEAHLAGTENDKRQAEWTRDQFQKFGLNATIETYWPLLTYPQGHRLAMISGPEHLRFEAKLTEGIIDEDETSKNPDNVPTFHGYSKNGTVTGRVVYANYGRREDFQYLVDRGINLNGTIALVRYGGAYRGLKVKAAEMYGCIGALVYSDPSDDGPLNKEGYPYIHPAEEYPNGPWRPKSSVQRGSVMFLSDGCGDPLTEGHPATENATRIRRDDSKILPKIPSLPLSWEDALPLLRATEGLGLNGGDDWLGGSKDVNYYSGPTEGEVILTNHVEDKITPVWNVIGRIEGAEEPERSIILGNHRDAWVYGAVDPSSGSAVMIELASVFGKLLEKGWRPRRTIIFASWDAEEYGLVGSVEWVEDHKEWLEKEGAVYLNVDTAVGGPYFRMEASPAIHRLFYQVTSQVTDPRTGKSVYEVWGEVTNATETPAPVPYIGNLASGSDYVPFMDHVGITSASFAFQGSYGVYHSNYDSFHWMEKFGDPEFAYHKTLCQIWGLLTLRLADDLILPLYPSDYADKLTQHVQDLEAHSHPYTFALLGRAVRKLSKKARKFERKRQRLESRLAEYKSVDDLPSVLLKRLQKANTRLTGFEKGFIDPQGVKGREWFKHVVYAPGLWSAYASQVFPAIVEGLDNHDLEQVRIAESRAVESIKQAKEWLKKD